MDEGQIPDESWAKQELVGYTDTSEPKTQLWSGQTRGLVMESMSMCQYMRGEYRPYRVRRRPQVLSEEQQH